MMYRVVRSLALRGRGVFSVPEHLFDDAVRAREYKIGRIRLAYTLEEGMEVLQRYEEDGVLGLDEMNVFLNKCAEVDNLEFGEKVIEMMRKYYENDLTVWEYNNIIYLYCRCWVPDKGLDAYLRLTTFQEPNNETYSNLIRLCIEGLKRSTRRRHHIKFTRIASAAIEQAEATCNIIDGRYHLLRTILHFHSVVGDDQMIAKYKAVIAHHNKQFQGR
eukprot:TRINITY_DN47122_c0_g1_i1.p1 TRINITY_DN47122_c0_g1~~TRINITY_DN47122_c0_g1_i1.p1  ORF type:complete len:217 (+),score=48.46 TRINITY_DN47122_c0_g1_i1:364-1014(+)